MATTNKDGKTYLEKKDKPVAKWKKLINTQEQEKMASLFGVLNV